MKKLHKLVLGTCCTIALWLIPIKANASNETQCLAKAIYFETYQGNDDSRLAVGWVLLNRRNDIRFPHSICEVVKQRGQFPWLGFSIRDQYEYAQAYRIAKRLMEYEEWYDPTQGAQFFASKLDGYFVGMIRKGHFRETVRIGGHRFYKWDDKKLYYE